MTNALPKFGEGTTIVVLGASGDLAKKKTVSTNDSGPVVPATGGPSSLHSVASGGDEEGLQIWTHLSSHKAAQGSIE